MFHGAYSYLRILTACVIPLVSACIVVPTGSEIDQGQIIEFQPGITHRSEVIDRIGEPNFFSEGNYDVYYLEEGQFYVMVFLDGSEGAGASETYNLVFHYDDNDILEELRYEKSLDPDDPDLILLDNDFTGRVNDFAADGEYGSGYISADSRFITAISETNMVIQGADGESREIELKQMNLDSWGYGIDCVIALYHHHRTKKNPDFNWLIGIEDLRPLYELCMTKGAFGVRAKGAYGVAADGSGLAVATTNQLEFLSQTGDVLSAPEADQAPIRDIWLNGMENHLVTSSVEHKIRFMQDPLVKTEIKIRSLPSLDTIESISRPFGVMATAMSSDNALFALASGSHVELWRRIKEPGESFASGGHYELERVIPKKPSRGFSGAKYLKFSPDGKYLMAVGDWVTKGYLSGRLYLWDTDDGRPVTEIAILYGFIEAAFNHNNEIVIFSGQEDWASRQKFTSRKYQSLKIWQLPLETLRGN
ncbi:MAG: WD40 repeat domain-containing protein [Gammaproteobacteria bacterium]|nr:WD40 repeat domain-containing protein [Gammaproteobacteria bacterium]